MIRFFRRIKLAPGLRLNLSRTGPSVSVGPEGAHVTVGPKGAAVYAGLPGTGLSVRHNIPPDCDCLFCQGKATFPMEEDDHIHAGCAFVALAALVIVVCAAIAVAL